MRNRQEIYEAIVREKKIWYENLYPEYSEDKRNRLSNIFAVMHTDYMYQKQFTRKRDRKYVIELIGNGQNIHGICSLIKMEKEEVMELLK